MIGRQATAEEIRQFFKAKNVKIVTETRETLTTVYGMASWWKYAACESPKEEAELFGLQALYIQYLMDFEKGESR